MPDSSEIPPRASISTTVDDPRLLSMQHISNSFPGVRALHRVNLNLQAGEVLALLGENGAGKSTLIKVLGGAHEPDEGSITISGEPVSIRTPLDSQQSGVSIIYQEFNLVPALTARENIFLGQEPARVSFIPKAREHQRSIELFQRIGVELDPEALVRDLTVAQQQVIEIAKALSIDARIIVMDEPTAALSPKEVEGLFRIIRELKSQGIGIIYVSHRLSEIFEIADRVTVLRDGELVGTKPIGELTRESMIEMMVGRKLQNEFPARLTVEGDASSSKSPTTEGLHVQGLCRGQVVRDVTFTARRGEILALTGLVGAGRTETARLIFGADTPDSGTVSLDGRTLKITSPRRAIAEGICLLTEDRKQQGLVLNRSVLENFGLASMKQFAPAGFITARQERDAFDGFVEQLQIRIPHRQQTAANLSGGNQQKVVLARWLQRNADVVILDEPTRGIDVGARYEFYVLMNQLVTQNKIVIMISSELPEVLGMADRILVMHNGRITGEIADARSATQEQIMELAVK